MRKYKISFQLFSARKFTPQDPILAELKRIGYDAVEPWIQDYGDDPIEFRKRIDDAGLECLGFHMPFAGLVNETQRFIDIALTIGKSPLMITPWLAPAERPTDSDGWRRIGQQLREGARRVRTAGLKVAWHNHDFEYRPVSEDGRPIDFLLDAAGTDVGYELDLAWVTRAWASPAEELRRYAQRILAVQVKDTAPPGTSAEGGWAATGDGIIDWTSVWPALDATAADQLVVEHDDPRDWRLVAQRSFDFLLKSGVRG